jgi:hypothetical protein
VQHGDMSLGVSIVGIPGEWKVIAIETDKRDAEEILESHAHEILGDFKRFSEAEKRAVLYAERWFERKAKEFKKKCACGPIRKKKR